MGGTGDRERLRSPDAVTFPLDLGLVSHDGDDAEFVAHVVARDRWWRRVLVAMNAQWIGSWNAGPRAHPNDGLLDVYDAALTLRELPAVRRRLVSGTHVPHPHIDHRRVRELNVSFDRGRWLFIDGRPAGRVRQLRIGIEPDRLRAVV
jgi:diacylglycerol kinase family enzyme